MQRIGDSTSSANGANEFTQGQPGSGIDATVITVAWLNAIQRELVNLVIGGGLTITPGDDSQLLKAILAIQLNAVTWAKLGGKPTTVAGFGISDAFTKTETTSAIQKAVSDLVASSPAALDTLKELATALGNDPNFATTMTNALAGKAGKATTLAGYNISDAFTKTEVTALTAQATEIKKGTARFATPQEHVGGLLNDVMSNPAGVMAVLAAWFPKRTFTENDYVRFPDIPGGLILQWGKTSITVAANGGVATVSLPTAFPTIHLGGFVTFVSSALVSGGYFGYYRPSSLANADLVFDVVDTTGGTGARSAFYFSIGN